MIKRMLLFFAFQTRIVFLCVLYFCIICLFSNFENNKCESFWYGLLISPVCTVLYNVYKMAKISRRQNVPIYCILISSSITKQTFQKASHLSCSTFIENGFVPAKIHVKSDFDFNVAHFHFFMVISNVSHISKFIFHSLFAFLQLETNEEELLDVSYEDLIQNFNCKLKSLQQFIYFSTSVYGGSIYKHKEYKRQY